MDKVYRVEDSEGFGPYSSLIYLEFTRQFAYSEAPAWCKMLQNHQMCAMHPGPFKDFYTKNSPFSNDEIDVADCYFGCPSALALLAWFDLIEDLVRAGFKIYELNVKKRYDSASGYQSVYLKNEVDSKRELSYKELVNLSYKEVKSASTGENHALNCSPDVSRNKPVDATVA